MRHCRWDHTEVVEFEFDPKVTSYAKLLDLFWNNHDPCILAPNTDEKHRTTQV